MCRRLIGVALAAGIVVSASNVPVASSNPPVAASGSIGIRLVDVPAGSRGDPHARVYIVERLAPGRSVRRQVEISNTTSSKVGVAVYPAAATLRRGRFGFAPGHSRNDLSTWTTPSRTVLRLAPGTKAVETVTIKVPAKASSGERYAVIWAEVSAPAPSGGGVTLVNRVGVRMYVSVGRGGAAPSNFVIDSLSARRSPGGKPLVVAKIHNSGGRTLGINGNLTLSRGPGGVRAGPFPVRLATPLASGASDLVRVRLDKRLARGPWRARLRLRSGLIRRVAVATIEFPRLEAGARPRASGDSGWPAPWILVLLALAALGLVFGAARRQRRHVGPPATVHD